MPYTREQCKAFAAKAGRGEQVPDDWRDKCRGVTDSYLGIRDGAVVADQSMTVEEFIASMPGMRSPVTQELRRRFGRGPVALADLEKAMKELEE